MTHSTLFRLFSSSPLLVALLGIAVLLGGCDSSSNVAEEDGASSAIQDAALADAVTTLSTAASLSAAQTNSLQELLVAYEDKEREPGDLWYLAADVHDQLTSTQIDRLKDRLEERRARRGDRRPMERHGPTHRPPRLRWLRGLDLTEAQKQELKALRAEYRDSFKALIEQCREGVFDEADVEQWKQLRTELQEAVHEILTAEQRAQLQARREQWKARRGAVRAARNEALSITEEQEAQFADLRPEFEGPGGWLPRLCHRPEGEERPIASILTEEQREIVMVHRVLRHGAMRGHKDRGPRR